MSMLEAQGFLSRHEATLYLTGMNRHEEAEALLKNGIDTMPSSLLLNFSLSELQESQVKIPEAKQVMEDVLAKLQSQSEKGQSEVQRLEEGIKEKLKPKEGDEESVRAPSIDGRKSAFSRHGDDDEDNATIISDYAEFQKEAVREDRKKLALLKQELELSVSSLNLTWVQYLKFSRRSEVK
jgi:hypothetical protein